MGGAEGGPLEAMFPEHWERGTGMWNVEHRFVKSWYEGVYLFRMFQSEMEHVPSVMGTMFPERCFFCWSFKSCEYLSIRC